MRRLLLTYLQAVLLIIGIGILLFLLLEPHVEGVNVGATLVEMYLDPFVLFAYVSSVPFFVALYNVCKLLGFVKNNTVDTADTVKALTIIQQCAVLMIVAVLIGATWLLLSESDDRPPIIGMATVATLFSFGVALAATSLRKKVQGALGHKM